MSSLAVRLVSLTAGTAVAVSVGQLTTSALLTEQGFLEEAQRTMQIGMRVPGAAVHGQRPRLWSAQGTDHQAIGGDCHHLGKAMLPAQGLRRGKGGVARDQMADHVRAARPFAQNLDARQPRAAYLGPASALFHRLGRRARQHFLTPFW